MLSVVKLHFMVKDTGPEASGKLYNGHHVSLRSAIHHLLSICVRLLFDLREGRALQGPGRGDGANTGVV